jgi:hypothetical protein
MRSRQGKQLLGHKHRERRTDRATDNTGCFPAKRERIKLGMIAGPALEWFRLPRALQPAHEVTIRIENADARHIHRRQALLPPGLAQ